MWAHNGPWLLTRILKDICNKEEIWDMTPEECWGFKVFPPEEFYPIHWEEWQKYFYDNYTGETLEMTKNATAVHLWNNLSFGEKTHKSQPQNAHAAIAAKNCPKVFETAGEYF